MTKISLTRPLHKSIPLRRRALKAFLGWVAFAFGLVWFGLVLGSQRDRTEIELKCRQLKLLREIFGLRVFALRLCGWGMWGVWGNATPFDDACVCACVWAQICIWFWFQFSIYTSVVCFSFCKRLLTNAKVSRQSSTRVIWLIDSNVCHTPTQPPPHPAEVPYALIWFSFLLAFALTDSNLCFNLLLP